jgi:hypothetical protein
MRYWALEKQYDKVVNRNRLLSEKQYSKKELATIIAAQDELLIPGTLSKDVRLQPLEGFDSSTFEDVLQDAGLTIVNKLLPGEKGSTSGQFITYVVSDEEGNEYKVVLGKGKGSTLKAEDFALQDIKQQIEAILIETEEEFIYVDVNGTKVKVDGIKNIDGTPKADFALTHKGDPVVYISHKDGSTPKDAQQYGGMTSKSGVGISDSEEVKQLAKDMRQKYPDGLQSRQFYFRTIKSEEVKLMSIYGGDYGESFGKDNVHVYLQGRVKIENKEGNTYTLEANHRMYNGFLPPVGDPYEPMFFVRFSGSRPSGNFGVKNSRFMIVPRGLIQSKIKQQENMRANIQQLDKTERSFEQDLANI